MAVVLEQLPATLEALRGSKDATLDFYEQGIERTLVMSGEGAMVVVHCASRHPTWKPRADGISMTRDELVSMLVQLAADFCNLLRRACSELAAHPWLSAWQGKLGPSS